MWRRRRTPLTPEPVVPTALVDVGHVSKQADDLQLQYVDRVYETADIFFLEVTANESPMRWFRRTVPPTLREWGLIVYIGDAELGYEFNEWRVLDRLNSPTGPWEAVETARSALSWAEGAVLDYLAARERYDR